MGRRSAEEREVWRTIRELVLYGDSRREVAEALDLSFVRVKALRYIADGPIPMRDLISRLETDAPHTTVVVDDLERRGYVVRTPHPDDKRAKIVSVTAEGRKAARRADAVLERPPRGMAGLDDAEVAELLRLLTVMIKNQTS